MKPEHIIGKFDSLANAAKDRIKELAMYYHHRDGKKADDGSIGSVHISYKQLLDMLAYFATDGKAESLQTDG
jgi:thiamine pyrophosphokinase